MSAREPRPTSIRIFLADGVPEGLRIGSRARVRETASVQEYLREQRAQLQERGVLVTRGAALVFAQDFRFTSPSNAAGVLVGGSANGRMAWKDREGRTLKALQEARTETTPTP